MAEWKKVKIGEVAKHRKGSVVIRDDAEYKLCRVQLHRRGVVLREVLRGADIKTKKQQLCHAGDLVVAEMDAKFGGYGFITDDLEGAIVSSHYYLFNLDSTKLRRDYFQVLIHSGVIQNQIEAKGSTNYSSIRAWEFLDYTVPLPDLEHQRVIAKRFHAYYEGRSCLDIQSDEQLSLLAQLRQSILQEAIEGKLTAKWRKQNPHLISGENHASKLLERIRAEKERLVREGKIRKEKPLPPITDDEKPIDLPEGWVWCRLGDMGVFARGKSKHRPRNDSSLFANGRYPFVQTGDVAQSKRTGYTILRCEKKYGEKGLAQSRLWEKGTLCITIAANIAETGFLGFDACFPDSVVGFTSLTGEATSFYVKYYLDVSRTQITRFAPATAQKNINLDIIWSLVFPVPPLAEQCAIAERVNGLAVTVDELGSQVSDRKHQSELLMQSVLREAFEQSNG